MASKIKLRRGTAQAWIDAGPVILDAGEPGYDSTNNKLKLGDGTTEWQTLPYLTDATVSLGNYSFDNNDLNIPGTDNTPFLPDTTKVSHLNAGGVGTPNSVQIRTVTTRGGEDDYQIVASEIAMEAGNGGFSAQVYGPWVDTGENGSGGPTLVYAGVENVSGSNGPGFAGFVASDPNVTSQYAITIDESNNIIIGATQGGGTATTNQYTATIGVLNEVGNVTGLLATPDKLVLSNTDNSWVFEANGSLTLPGTLTFSDTSVQTTAYLGAATTGSLGGIKLGNGFVLDNDNKVRTTKLVATDHDFRFELLEGGTLRLPDGSEIIGSTLKGTYGTGGLNYTGITIGPNSGNSEESWMYVDYTGAYIATQYNTNQKLWTFGNDGNLKLPAGGDIVDSNGISVLDGISSQLVNGEAVLALNANGLVTFPNETIQSTAYELPVGVLTNQELSIDVVLDRPSTNNYWYNLFGDTGATIDANTTVNGSVCHDTGGNVYALGSVTHSVGFNTDNLFLKYSPEGNLLWRRTWTDDAGMECGSLNASLRFIAANVELGTQDTIAWASWVPTQNISYVGTMDTEGNMVDQFGDSRLATRLDSVRVTDLEWVGNAYGDGNSIVGVVGNYYLFDGNDQYRPFAAVVDLDLGGIIYNSTLVPVGSDSTSGGWYNRSFDNIFKAITVPGNVVSAFVGTYYDGDYSHAMIAVSGEGTELFQIGQGTDDNIGEDICCDANGNVYVIVNNITSNYAVLSKVNLGALLATQDSVWQIQLGFDPITVNDSFYASAVAYDNGYVYVLGTYYNVEDDNTDTMLIKVGIGNGDVVWQRRIGTAVDEGPAGAGVFGAPGWESSSGISIYDNLIAVTFSTEDNSVDELNTVTLQYPTDGSILGTFGDFTITDFDIGSIPADYGITTLTASVASAMATAGLATLDPTVQTVGTGWTNTQWDLENNREVTGAQTFKFMADGTFDTPEIRHQSNVKITANTTVANATPSTWTFQNNDGLRFPDGSVQYGAYIETEMSMDGGSAVTVFNIVPRPLVVDGGGSASRFGINDPVYDGSSGNDYVLDGGGA